MRCVLTLFFILFNCNVNPGILIGILQKRFQKWPDQFRELPKLCPWQLRKKPQDCFDVGSQRTYHVVHPVSLFSTIVVPWPGHFLIGASFFSVPDCTPKNLHMALRLCQGSWSTLVSPLYPHHLLGLYLRCRHLMMARRNQKMACRCTWTVKSMSPWTLSNLVWKGRWKTDILRWSGMGIHCVSLTTISDIPQSMILV